MKCDRCGGKAAYQMRHHHLALCKADYLEWLPARVERSIKKTSMFTQADRILAAVSGGKDSFSLWDILNRLGYQADGLYIHLGIDTLDYSSHSQALCERFADTRGLRLIVVNLAQEYGLPIQDMARREKRGAGKPCAVCGLAKRHIMNRVASQGGYTAVATGHNLDDEAAVLLGNTLEWKLDSLQRQAPVLAEKPGLSRKVKPLCRVYEREAAAYALLSGIEYIYEECPYAAGSKAFVYKDLLNRMEAERPGAKLSFYLEFLRARREGFLDGVQQEATAELHTCPVCGQPTTSAAACAFCRMVGQAQAVLSASPGLNDSKL